MDNISAFDANVLVTEGDADCSAAEECLVLSAFDTLFIIIFKTIIMKL